MNQRSNCRPVCLNHYFTPKHSRKFYLRGQNWIVSLISWFQNQLSADLKSEMIKERTMTSWTCFSFSHQWLLVKLSGLRKRKCDVSGVTVVMWPWRSRDRLTSPGESDEVFGPAESGCLKPSSSFIVWSVTILSVLISLLWPDHS